MENQNSQIQSDVKLKFELLKKILLFLLMLIPNLIGGLWKLLLLDTTSSKNYFKKIFIFPFEIFQIFSNWFFQAKYTAYITLTLIIIYLIQIIFLSSELTNALMSNSQYFLQIESYTNLTSVFLHGNLAHLLTNLLALNIFGRIVEKTFDYKIIYLFLASGFLSNLISNTISYLKQDFYFSLGASGAIAGLIILAILLNPFQFTSILIIPLPIFLIGWGLIFIDIIGLSNPSQTNNLAHIGGYLSLLILMFVIEINKKNKIYLGLAINTILLIVLYLLIKLNLLPNLF